MSDLIIRAFAIIGALTVCYHLDALSRRIAKQSARRALSTHPKHGGEDG